MKEVTREKTITEVAYYEAIDGMHFQSKEECERYERSAEMVVLAELEPYKVGMTTPYDLYDGEGSEEYDIDIYTIPNAEVLRKLNTYRLMCASSQKVIGEEYIGKVILLTWDYDHQYSYCVGTIDDVIARIRKVYYATIAPKEEKEN